MKQYKLLKDLPAAKAGTVVTQYDRALHLADNTTLLTSEIVTKLQMDNEFDDWFGEVDEGKAWKPKHGKKYWYLMKDGSIGCDYYMDGIQSDEGRIKIGNYFRTEEDAREALKKLKALHRLLHEDGLKFKKWEYEIYAPEIKISASFDPEYESLQQLNDDLDLLFMEGEE
nr:hypothetical protein [uncultured Dysosmobacter sp.]